MDDFIVKFAPPERVSYGDSTLVADGIGDEVCGNIEIRAPTKTLIMI
jgi:hypothetical protein